MCEDTSVRETRDASTQTRNASTHSLEPELGVAGQLVAANLHPLVLRPAHNHVEAANVLAPGIGLHRDADRLLEGDHEVEKVRSTAVAVAGSDAKPLCAPRRLGGASVGKCKCEGVQVSASERGVRAPARRQSRRRQQARA